MILFTIHDDDNDMIVWGVYSDHEKADAAFLEATKMIWEDEVIPSVEVAKDLYQDPNNLHRWEMIEVEVDGHFGLASWMK